MYGGSGMINLQNSHFWPPFFLLMICKGRVMLPSDVFVTSHM